MPDTVTETRSPTETIQQLFGEVLNRRDADALVEYWAEDIVEEFPVGTFRGRDEVRRYFAETFAAVSDFHIEAQRIVGEGETVFVKWRITGTFSGAPWMGIEPNGTRIEIDGIDWFTFRDGLVARNYVLYDSASFARQIGMLPKQGSSAERARTTAFNAQVKLRKRLRS